MAINCNMSVDACSKLLFKVEVGPIHVNNVFTDLGDDDLEFSMIFEDGTGALCDVFDREVELISIISADGACLARLDEPIKGGELVSRHLFCHEPEFRSAGKKGCHSFHFLLLVSRCSNMRTNLEDPGIDNGKGCVFSGEE